MNEETANRRPIMLSLPPREEKKEKDSKKAGAKESKESKTIGALRAKGNVAFHLTGNI